MMWRSVTDLQECLDRRWPLWHCMLTGGNVSRSVNPRRLAATAAGTFCTVTAGFCVPSWLAGCTACCDTGAPVAS